MIYLEKMQMYKYKATVIEIIDNLKWEIAD